MRIVHYYARALTPESGVTASIRGWGTAQADLLGVPVHVVHAQEGCAPAEASPLEHVRVMHFGRSRSTWLPVGLLSYLKRHDLLVLHEGWVLGNFVAGLLARSRGVKYLVVPHGVYEPEMVAGQRDVFGIRRRLESLTLRGAEAVHVFYSSELCLAETIAGRRLNAVVAPNGIQPSGLHWRGGGKYFSFLGRLDVSHKGLDILVRGWTLLPEPRPLLRIHGPDFRDGRRQLSRLIDDLLLGQAVCVGDELEGRVKEDFLRFSEGNLHLSRWESCSVALLEHLELGVPCAVADHIHVAGQLSANHAAITVRLKTDSVPKAVEALVLQAEELSRAARDLVAREYSWPGLVAGWRAQLLALGVLEARRHAD